MKIGILTFHRAHNYGAVLQCFALQEVLKLMGHDVQVLDYRQPFIEELYSPFNLHRFSGLLIHPRILYRYCKSIPWRLKRKNIFNSFLKKHILTTMPFRTDMLQDFDIYVIGSDQLWGLHCLGGIADDFYMGNFKHTPQSKVIGYAISTNLKSLEELGESRLIDSVHNFSKLSMREEFAADYIEKQIGIKPSLCLDPTLLTNHDVWKPLINDKWKNEKYILMYEVRRLKDNPNMLQEKAKSLADIYNCKIIDLSSMTYSVEDFVSLFKYAQYVVTTSFHATVFSIIFNTPFYSIKLNDGHDGRYVNLLNALGLEACCVEKDFICSPQEIDFSSAKDKLETLRSTSCEFLLEL